MNAIITLIATILGVTGAVAILGLILGKLFPKERFNRWGDSAENSGGYCGKVITDWLSQLPYIGRAWNKALEPYLILALDNIIVRWIMGFVSRKGLLSDNPE